MNRTPVREDRGRPSSDAYGGYEGGGRVGGGHNNSSHNVSAAAPSLAGLSPLPHRSPHPSIANTPDTSLVRSAYGGGQYRYGGETEEGEERSVDLRRSYVNGVGPSSPATLASTESFATSHAAAASSQQRGAILAASRAIDANYSHYHINTRDVGPNDYTYTANAARPLQSSSSAAVNNSNASRSHLYASGASSSAVFGGSASANGPNPDHTALPPSTAYGQQQQRAAPTLAAASVTPYQYGREPTSPTYSRAVATSRDIDAASRRPRLTSVETIYR